MKEIAELRSIVENQKTVKTSRIEPLVEAVQKAYVESGKKIKRQQDDNQRQQMLHDHRVEKLNKKHQLEIKKLKDLNAKMGFRLGLSMMSPQELKKVMRPAK
jgi:hypothetical protein